MFLGELVEFLAAFKLMIGVAERFGIVKQGLEQLFALKERSLAKVVAVAIEKVKNEVGDRNLRHKGVAGRLHVHALLEALEVAMATGVESDDFAVENRCARAEVPGKRGELGITPGDVDVIAGSKRQAAVRKPRQCADAIPFDFEEPVGIGKRTAGKSGEHRLYARGHHSLADRV